MATVRPFCAVRPRKDLVSRIAALPYDVYNTREAKEEVKKEPLSFLAIDRAETQFDEDVDIYAPCVYLKAKELLQEKITDGSFQKEEKAAYYIYELTMKGRVQTGIVACASIDEYLNGRIKKHENTRAEKEEDRIQHVDTLNAQTGPIFLAYREEKAVDAAVEKVKRQNPEYDFVSSDGITHRVWIVSESDDISAIKSGFDKVKDIYIADGHHRAASAVKVGLKRRQEHPGYTGEEEFNYFLSVLFPHNQLLIMDYNRVIRDLNGWGIKEFLEKVSEKFILEQRKEAYRPERKETMGMYIFDTWYKLTARPEICKNHPVEGLAVSLLQNEILNPILGILDPKADKRIDFVGGIRGLSELEHRCKEDMTLAFSLYPTSIEELFSVADEGLLMPPKSTWFEPKLRSGIFIHEF